VEDEGHLTIESSVEGDTARVVLQGELDLHGVEPVNAELDQLTEQGVKSVLVDTSGLTFLDSSGLRTLLTGREKFSSLGGQLKVVESSPAVARVLDMTATRSLLEG
jgi:anti-sigma B factor antagonist